MLVPVPMCLRPAAHEASMGELAAWRREADAAVSAIGGSFEALDGGPSSDELMVRCGRIAGARPIRETGLGRDLCIPVSRRGRCVVIFNSPDLA